MTRTLPLPVPGLTRDLAPQTPPVPRPTRDLAPQSLPVPALTRDLAPLMLHTTPPAPAFPTQTPPRQRALLRRTLA